MSEPEGGRLARLLGDGRSIGLCVVNHGCKVNRVEGDSFAAALLKAGAKLVDEPQAELVIVNTCTVTAEADKKARKAVRHAQKLAPQALVVVTGCGAAIDSAGFEELGDAVEVVSRARLSQLLGAHEGGLRYGSSFRTRVNLKVQDGCNHACTYCIVHVARGAATSMAYGDVLSEAARYFQAGAKELVLTGIDLGSYHSDGKGLHDLALDLSNLACEYAREGELPARIRASSLEPMSIAGEFASCLALQGGRICRHLHVPLQSGSTKVLREMARPYTADDYLNLVGGLYERIPELSLTTDIIVGFPGETDDDFEQTLEVAKACRFSKIHVFPYSKRKGTPAADRADQIPADIARRRAAQLRELSAQMRARDLARRAGVREVVLVEPDHALTESYHEVRAPRGVSVGQLCEVVL